MSDFGEIRWIRGALALLLLCAPLGAAAETPTLPNPTLPDGVDFGAGLTLGQTTPLARVAETPERYAEDPVLLRGRLTDLCVKKGCWTVLADGEHFVRIRFRDYGFFLPADALGKTALVEGIAETRQLSGSEARHFAAESAAASGADASNSPRRELGFVATGVRLLSRDPAKMP